MSDKDYKKTLNLPVTKFNMKANLTQKEPEMLKWWEANKVYDAMLEAARKSGGGKTYMLHDGPPYANGHIHLGTALNKILKDIAVKSHSLQGFVSPYVPGWDCHGLPIELKVEHELGEKKKELPAHVVRRRCRQYAEKFLDIQRKEFKRLGVFGMWDKPYMTMDPVYEATTAAELANFVERGELVRSKKPIYWCCSCQTALAEAEVEYADHKSPSVYVRYPFAGAGLAKAFPTLPEGAEAYVVIWTTTPWTLPCSMAVSLHPEFEYSLIRHESAYYLLASELVERCAKIFDWIETEEVGRVLGTALEGFKGHHPFLEREIPLLLGTHVTLEAGTGCVHTAPGHGREDYDVSLKYGVEVYSPLDNEGRYLPSVEFFAGQKVQEANPAVIAKLEELGHLLAKANITHSYPHCWRCKKPVIFRATTQWFISMNAGGLRGKALAAIRDDVDWIPSWGEERIYGMIETRPDWCISRQRTWGVPILALLCEDCGEAWNDPKWMREIAAKFAVHPTGCDWWYEHEMADIVPAGLKCPHCGGDHWKRETDILDVWFDSGTSFAAVLEQRPELSFPADLYLEGSDQHRGWFHSSLLASMGTRGVPPYKAVLTHGYVVDGKGLKMSKSVGNVVAPQEIIDKFGAEILRLWVSSVDYREDIRISDEILNRQVDAYRRIRNTCRYLLSSISDLTPEGMPSANELDPLDRYALDVTLRAHNRVQQAYTDYEFHKVFHTLHTLCSADLSAFYFDVLKDRLYASAPNWKERRSAQTALYYILMLLIRDMAPILSFTAEEVFGHIPAALNPGNSPSSVFVLPEANQTGWALDDDTRARWDAFMTMREDVTRAIEPLRKAGEVGHGLDTRVSLFVDAERRALLESPGSDVRAMLIVSQVHIADLSEAPASAFSGECEGLKVLVERARGEKCERCWIYSEELGTNAEHPTLCPRCVAAVTEMSADGLLGGPAGTGE